MQWRVIRVTGEIGPDYQRLMNQLRSKIESGEYPVGSPIPSTTELRQITGMSVPVIRRAVGQLEADGILEGHAGKAVYVKATPSAKASERQDMDTLGEQVQALRRDVGDLADRADKAKFSDLARILADIQETVGRVEDNLINLYQQTGHAYPQGGLHDSSEQAPRRRKPK